MRFAIISIVAVFFIIFSFIIIVAKNNQHNSNNKKAIAAAPASITNYDDSSSSVSFITFGNLVANSQRTAVRITVTSANVDISILNGYQETVVNSESFANNLVAYKEFLSNLNANKFLTSKKTNLQEASACPSGETYEMILTNNLQTVSDLWDDNCNTGVDGTFAGNGQQNVFAIQTLFENQIPNYPDFTSNYTF